MLPCAHALSRTGQALPIPYAIAARLLQAAAHSLLLQLVHVAPLGPLLRVVQAAPLSLLLRANQNLRANQARGLLSLRHMPHAAAWAAAPAAHPFLDLVRGAGRRSAGKAATAAALVVYVKDSVLCNAWQSAGDAAAASAVCAKNSVLWRTWRGAGNAAANSAVCAKESVL
eukprot:1155975-Pelagomonas_calceolata.AAC.4